MKHPCATIQARLLDHGGTEDKEVRAHLEACPDCRRLAETWQVFRSAPLPERVGSPPESIDFAIRREAFAVAADRTRHHHALTRWVSLAAVAACVMLIAGVVLSMFRADRPDPMPSPPAALAQAADVDWNQLGLDEDFFALNAELEITFAMLTVADSSPPLAAETPRSSPEATPHIAL
jgi:hypothetical protein